MDKRKGVELVQDGLLILDFCPYLIILALDKRGSSLRVAALQECYEYSSRTYAFATTSYPGDTSAVTEVETIYISRLANDEAKMASQVLFALWIHQTPDLMIY